MTRAPHFKRTMLASAILLLAAQTATAQTATDNGAKADEQTVVVLGSRSVAKTALDTSAPVGLIGLKDLQTAGPLELGKLLQTLDPSFNFSTTFISDGTDSIRPATLRSLGPDQVLVLINGKRRHQQALVNVQQTIGRGSAGTDINAIPLGAIHHIEVLRDGAAAQYGSDAIAGVINIVLKSNVGETALSGQLGTTSEGDGDLYSASANRGFALGENGGYINLTLEGRKRGETNRAGPDSLRVSPPRVTQHIGDSNTKDGYFWWNGSLPIDKASDFYAFGGVSKRKSDSYGFFRSAGDDRTVPAVYPNGFLPAISTDIKDASFAFGYRHDLPRDWKADISINYGRSELAFHESNSLNVSYWYEPKPGGGIYAESPREADTGTLKFSQLTFNADVKGPVRFGDSEVSLATGFEYRQDNYQIVAGDPVSYQYGRSNNPAIPITTPSGATAAAGIQGFPGYTPGTAVDSGRHNIALFLDAETKPIDTLTLGGAVRYEKYSDFGSTVTGKLSGRFDPTREVGFRASLSTGFRAPSVQQEFYSSVSTNLNNGVLTETLTARQGSAVTQAFGIKPLKEETSRNGSIGVVLRPVKDFSLTADAYEIKIKDRIVFSSEIAPEAGGGPIANILRPLGVGQAQFFTNAVDTRTRGLDVVAENTTRFDNSTLVLSGQLGFNKTEVTKRHSTSSVLSGEKLFDASQVTLIEHGQPRKHHVVAADYTAGAWNVNTRANYYGPVEASNFSPLQKWDARWLVDASVRYGFSKRTFLSLGINNAFNQLPNLWTNGGDFPKLGFTRCWETCPIGLNGRSFYVRADTAF
ncbi:iron complex outermembrane receptor protein [Duganella sp. 1224]|uniref:TonB-dependent receptor plug domain-containing protein n=1 Tax=Duganella sp. 1224 TaxID=2587052 RepID=UPI0015C69AAD|nr:TonB-dependent receptor [Duganella sp. 1224]NYE64019.1 iron complex outermembrane receptor protein [Duganella sp. 1224]